MIFGYFNTVPVEPMTWGSVVAVVREMDEMAVLVRRLMHAGRRRLAELTHVPPSLSIPSHWRLAWRPVDVAHWAPHMPRGAEKLCRGGVRVTNADGVIELRRSENLGPIRSKGVLVAAPG